MKKCSLILAVLLIMLINPIGVRADEPDLASNAKSAIMIEASTGEILYQKNIQDKYAPASMTKMMSLLLFIEQIESGKIKWDQLVTVSANASSMGGSQIYLKTDEKMSVHDLMKGIAIASGNDATIAMAELVAGSEEAFVELMNNKASDLGLKNTNFKNPTGLDAANHYSTAYDMSLIAQQLVKHPKILELTGTYEDYLRVDQKEKFWLVNTNKLVRFYQGVDGLKTGYTEEAGYCLTTTATRNGMRLITVVMGEPDTGKRSADTSKMLDYGFNMYEANKVLSKSTVVGTAKVEKGNVKTTQLVPTEDIILLNKKASSKRDITYELKLNHIKAPVTVGDKVGLIKIIEDKKIIKTIDLTVNQKITKIGIFKLYMRHLEDIFSGNIKF